MNKLKIAYLYSDLLELYGDRGNITVLTYRCKELGIDLIVNEYTVGEVFDANDYDLVFLGGGADNDQSIIYEDLLTRRDNFSSAIENNTVFLLICGGYQMFGKYYKTLDGKIIEGLNLFDFYTEGSVDRSVGYICVDVTLPGESFKLVGFENHGGQTYNVKTPIGNTIAGFGNNHSDKIEGFNYKNVFGTYIHGPLLSRNPEFTDLLIKRMINGRDFNVNFEVKDFEFELKAKQVILDENKQ